MTVQNVDIMAACDGTKDVWQTAVQVANSVSGGAITNVTCNQQVKAPAGKNIIRCTDTSGKILVDGSTNGSFYTCNDVKQQMNGGSNAAPAGDKDPGAAIRSAMAAIGGMFGMGGGDAAAGGEAAPPAEAAKAPAAPAGGGGSLPKGNFYTVSLAPAQGVDVWQAAVQAGSLRACVQEKAGVNLCDVIVDRAGKASSLLSAEKEGLGAALFCGGTVAELEAQVAKSG